MLTLSRAALHITEIGLNTPPPFSTTMSDSTRPNREGNQVTPSKTSRTQIPQSWLPAGSSRKGRVLLSRWRQMLAEIKEAAAESFAKAQIRVGPAARVNMLTSCLWLFKDQRLSQNLFGVSKVQFPWVVVLLKLDGSQTWISMGMAHTPKRKGPPGVWGLLQSHFSS